MNIQNEGARSIIVENTLIPKQIGEFDSCEEKSKQSYYEFVEHLLDCDEKVGVSNLEQIMANAGIIYKYNYRQIEKVKDPDMIVDYLNLIGDNDYKTITIITNYLLDKTILNKLNKLSAMRDFDVFKERLITTIEFRAKILNPKNVKDYIPDIDVLKLINDLLSYYNKYTREFHRVRA